MSVDTRKVGFGALLLVLCSVAMLAMGVVEIPVVTGSVAVLGLAAGALLVGTSGTERPV